MMAHVTIAEWRERALAAEAEYNALRAAVEVLRKGSAENGRLGGTPDEWLARLQPGLKAIDDYSLRGRSG